MLVSDFPSLAPKMADVWTGFAIAKKQRTAGGRTIYSLDECMGGWRAHSRVIRRPDRTLQAQ